MSENQELPAYISVTINKEIRYLKLENNQLEFDYTPVVKNQYVVGIKNSGLSYNQEDSDFMNALVQRSESLNYAIRFITEYPREPYTGLTSTKLEFVALAVKIHRLYQIKENSCFMISIDNIKYLGYIEGIEKAHNEDLIKVTLVLERQGF